MRAEALVALEGSEEVRVHLQRSIIAKTNNAGASSLLISHRARLLSALAALRMHLDALRTGRCPAAIAPRALGAPVQIKRSGDGIDVLPPPPFAKRTPVAHISCP